MLFEKGVSYLKRIFSLCLLIITFQNEKLIKLASWSAEAAEYTDYISAEG